ncbi:MAG: NCS2 family permease [Eubacteriaceae bacterium]
MNKTFKLEQNHTNVRTEILAGVTTFLTMAYIIFVNPNILSQTGMDFGAVTTATCLSAALATFCMAFMANYPFALAPGMGLNAFFTYSVCLVMGVPWHIALTAVFVEGIIFIILTLTSIREAVANCIPKTLKIGISAGIGLFITFIGLQNGGVIINNDSTLLGLTSFNVLNATGETYTNLMSAILTIIGLILIIVLEIRHIKGGILIGIAAVTILGIPFGITQMPTGIVSLPPSIAPVFCKLDFSALANPEFWIIVFTFFFVDFFDTIGTLVGVASRADMLDEKGQVPNISPALMADAIGTTAGAVLGTSTVTTFVESASGVEQGGRTGLTAFTTACLFLLALFFSPLIAIVPSCATAPALIMVGGYMMMNFKEMDFSDWTEFFPALIAFFMMGFSYSIATGIEFGIISYVLIKIFVGKAKDINWILYILAAVFLANLLFFAS